MTAITVVESLDVLKTSNGKSHIHQLIRGIPETFRFSQESERVLTETMEVA